ncbi:hypothetical protein BKA69DRAFT_1084153 [Paraphysoderma sedebokerense]|nr:hypothetical protein BKA69DRAFT_1084153 [Paraphysoderma sedebokerense]
MDNEGPLAYGIFMTMAIPCLLTSIYWIKVASQRYQAGQTSLFNKGLLLSWILTFLYVFSFVTAALLDACHRADTLRKAPVTVNSCPTAWMRLSTTLLFIIGATIFAFTTTLFCSIILSNVSLFEQVNAKFPKWGYTVLHFALITATTTYAIANIMLFYSDPNSPELKRLTTFRLISFIVCLSFPASVCIIAALLSLKYILSLKSDLSVLNLQSSRISNQILTSQKIHKRKLYISIAVIFIDIVLYGIIILFELEFPWLALKFTVVVLALATMSTFMFSTLDLLKSDHQTKTVRSEVYLNSNVLKLSDMKIGGGV